MAFRTGTANGYIHLLDLLSQYIRGWAYETSRSTPTMTGNGTLTRFNAKTSAVAETWTLTCTTAGSAGIFSVIGSVSGTAATAVVGTAYTNTQIEFLLSDGATDFVVGDRFVVVLSATNVPTASQWAIQRLTGGGVSLTSPMEVIARGPGAGTDSIYAGILTVSNVGADWFNWKVGGFTGFNTASTFELQPGYSGEQQSPTHVPLWNSDIPFWFIANGRRMIVVAKVSTVYELMYLGYITPYSSPGQFPYPNFVGGSLSWDASTVPVESSANWRWSYAGIEHGHFWDPVPGSPISSINADGWAGGGRARLRLVTGTWRDFYSGASGVHTPSSYTSGNKHWNGVYATMRDDADGSGIWPGVHQCAAMGTAPDGSYVLLPHILFTGNSSADAPDLIGELEGLYWVTGQGLAAEDIINQGGTDHLVVQNVFRTTRDAYCAVRLS